jgi:DNA-binding MarR family transcriptional regulator
MNSIAKNEGLESPGVTNRTGAERSPSFLIARIDSRSARGLRERLAPFGVEPRQFALMHQVALESGRSQQAIADSLGIPKSAMVGLVDELEARGLVVRRRNDRRTHALHLSDAGIDLLRRAARAAYEHDEELLAPLTGAERDQLLRILGKLAGQPA